MALNVEFTFNRADNRLLVSTLRMLLYPHEHDADPEAKPAMMVNRGFKAISVLLNYGSPKVSCRTTQLELEDKQQVRPMRPTTPQCRNTGC